MTETVQAELIGSFAAVLVAIVGLVGVVLQSNRRTRQENSEQHAAARVAERVDKVESELDRLGGVTFGSEDCVVGVQ